MAVRGALACECERTLGDDSPLTPIRWSVDLYRPTRMAPVTVSAAVVRSGRRMTVIDAVASQDGRATARSTAFFATATDQPASGVWVSDLVIEPPSTDGDDFADSVERLYWDDGRGWLEPGTPFYTPARKSVWHFPIPIVDDEPPSAFVSSAAIADVVNAVASVGPEGLSFINTDAVVHYSRAPRPGSIGMVLTTRSEHAGIAASGALVFDRDGVFGHVSSSGLSNPPILLLGHPLPTV